MSNAAFPCLLGVVVIDSTNNSIKMTENATTANVTIASGSYFLRGDGASDDLCKAIKTALDSNANITSPNTYTVAITRDMSPSNPTATVTISATGGSSFKLFWSDTVNTTFDPALIGVARTDTALDTSAKSGLLSPSCLWTGNDIYRSLEPIPYYRRGLSRAISGKIRAVKRSGEIRDRLWVQEYIEERRMNQEAITADTTRALNLFVSRHADGKRFEFHDGAISSGTTLGALSSTTLVGTFQFGADFYPSGGSFAARIEGAPLYSFTGHLLPYVA